MKAEGNEGKTGRNRRILYKALIYLTTFRNL
jgi:hypothetical protein